MITPAFCLKLVPMQQRLLFATCYFATLNIVTNYRAQWPIRNIWMPPAQNSRVLVSGSAFTNLQSIDTMYIRYFLFSADSLWNFSCDWQLLWLWWELFFASIVYNLLTIWKKTIFHAAKKTRSSTHWKVSTAQMTLKQSSIHVILLKRNCVAECIRSGMGRVCVIWMQIWWLDRLHWNLIPNFLDITSSYQ